MLNPLILDTYKCVHQTPPHLNSTRPEWIRIPLHPNYTKYVEVQVQRQKTLKENNSQICSSPNSYPTYTMNMSNALIYQNMNT